MSGSDDLDVSADALKALAHPVRLAILRTLIGGERSVGDIEQVAGIPQPSLSQQLAILRNAALVETRREAKLIFYRLSRERLAGLGALIDSFVPDAATTGGDESQLRDRFRSGGGAAMFAQMD